MIQCSKGLSIAESYSKTNSWEVCAWLFTQAFKGVKEAMQRFFELSIKVGSPVVSHYTNQTKRKYDFKVILERYEGEISSSDAVWIFPFSKHQHRKYFKSEQPKVL
ncbi:hypothetical protein TNCT_71011 [Trichonephila clavata]|uniref:Uncharacterized protein n=1 Tax=Trichonephila clavata TaxID=2740835 RepID=A0A8X6H9W0_TRICU|nr:hypothetical protein TNCT_71011 [Trichonephila clavata]